MNLPDLGIISNSRIDLDNGLTLFTKCHIKEHKNEYKKKPS